MNSNDRNGTLYELLLYNFLRENYICFEPQVHVNKIDCFKHSGDYISDGKITCGFSDSVENEQTAIYFDVKSFGLSEPQTIKLKKKIQNEMPEYIITVGGCLDASTSDMNEYALSKINDIISELKKQKLGSDTLIYTIKELNLIIRAIPKHQLNTPYISDISTFNPYKWAEMNELYFIRHGSQFCTNKPFIIFCPFDQYLAPLFSSNLSKTNEIAFRALARRIFMKLIHSDEPLKKYDGKALDNVKVSDAARKLSAIVFIDVGKKHEYGSNSTWAYINPNADNQIPKYQIEQLFLYNGALVDYFFHDNY